MFLPVGSVHLFSLFHFSFLPFPSVIYKSSERDKAEKEEEGGVWIKQKNYYKVGQYQVPYQRVFKLAGDMILYCISNVISLLVPFFPLVHLFVFSFFNLYFLVKTLELPPSSVCIRVGWISLKEITCIMLMFLLCIKIIIKFWTGEVADKENKLKININYGWTRITEIKAAIVIWLIWVAVNRRMFVYSSDSAHCQTQTHFIQLIQLKTNPSPRN